MRTPLRQASALFQLAVELYQRHRPDDRGYCGRCHQAGCLVQQHAALVIRAAGRDPALLRPPPRRPEATYWTTAATSLLPTYRTPSRP